MKRKLPELAKGGAPLVTVTLNMYPVKVSGDGPEKTAKDPVCLLPGTRGLVIIYVPELEVINEQTTVEVPVSVSETVSFASFNPVTL